jgi:RNAse (barnase) inhibitor barstar
MPQQQSVFRFDEFTPAEPPAFVADMPAAIGSKEALLAELAQRLQFPDYFGANWDALHECIRDLSWLPNGPIVVRHKDLPLADDIANAKTYLSVLDDAVRRVSESQDHSLVIVFPPETRGAIEWLLRSAASEQLKR